MEYTYLGKTGLQVSRLCLGTMNFGRVTLYEEMLKQLDEIFPPAGIAPQYYSW